MTSPYAQHGYRAAFDWGPVGAAVVRGGLVAEDVAIAAEVDTSQLVPVLRDGVFRIG